MSKRLREIVTPQGLRAGCRNLAKWHLVHPSAIRSQFVALALDMHQRDTRFLFLGQRHAQPRAGLFMSAHFQMGLMKLFRDMVGKLKHWFDF